MRSCLSLSLVRSSKSQDTCPVERSKAASRRRINMVKIVGLLLKQRQKHYGRAATIYHAIGALAVYAGVSADRKLGCDTHGLES